jgi:glucan phosphorylase
MSATPSPDLLARYECDGFRFPDRDYYDRHVVFDHVVPLAAATQRERFEAVARTLRDVLTQRWIKTADTHDRANPKQVYYLSMEFLIGRSLTNNIVNLGVEEFVREDLRSDPRQDWTEVIEAEPDAAGKAAPAYHLAKVIIRLVAGIGRVVNADPAVRGKLRVEFLPNYSCTLAERLIPAADVSEQISTAGYEASGTSNMKFMMTGALTVGTRDGANIEIAEEAGEENCFMFGLTADQVLGGRGWYSPAWHYENEPETRAALDLIFGNHFSPDEPGAFEPIRQTLLARGDYYLHLADLAGYVRTQERVAAVYPADYKWVTRAVVADVITTAIRGLDLKYPGVSAEQRKLLDEARAKLARE